MQRVCITHAGGSVVISCAPMSGRGTTKTIHCGDQTRAAKNWIASLGVWTGPREKWSAEWFIKGKKY